MKYEAMKHQGKKAGMNTLDKVGEAAGENAKLDSSHLEYVIGYMQNTTSKISNIKAYMVTALYNAPSTINHYYQKEVQHDMYGGGWSEKGIV